MQDVTIKKFYNLKYDLVFKNVLFNGSDLELSSRFLSMVARKKVKVLRIENTELPNQKIRDKSSHVDVLLYTSDGYYHLEMNPRNVEYLNERNFAYACNIIAQKSLKGGKIDKTRYTQINFTFGLKSEEDREVYNVQNVGNKLFVQNFEIIEINMDKVLSYWYTQNELEIEKYKYLIALDLNEEDLRKISKNDKYLIKIYEGVIRMNSEHRFVALMSREEDIQMQHNMDLDIARRDGRKEGKIEGMQEGVAQRDNDIVRNMHENNYSINDIVKITKLPIEYVQKILGIRQNKKISWLKIKL